MQFSTRNLSVLAYAQGFTLWHYKAGDLPSVGRPGYFDAGSDMLGNGDMMLVSAPEGGCMLCLAAEAGRVWAAKLTGP